MACTCSGPCAECSYALDANGRRAEAFEAAAANIGGLCIDPDLPLSLRTLMVAACHLWLGKLGEHHAPKVRELDGKPDPVLDLRLLRSTKRGEG